MAITSKSEEEKRQALIKGMLGTRTLEDIEWVMQQSEPWLKQHPDDIEVAMTGEGMYMLYTALLDSEKERNGQ